MLLLLQNYCLIELMRVLTPKKREKCPEFSCCLDCGSFTPWSLCSRLLRKKSVSWLLVLKLLFLLKLTWPLMIMLREAKASWASVGVSGTEDRRDR